MVNIASAFLFGFITAVIGVLPPGLLNMSAAKISLDEGRSRGFIFSLGATVVILLQAYIAVVFARYLSKNPEVINILRIIALVVFVAVTIYFLFIAKAEKKEKKKKRKGKKSTFFYGVFLSLLNVLPIPFYGYMSITLASYDLMNFSNDSIFSYVIAVGFGSFLVLYMYALIFRKIKNKIIIPKKNMNYIIGGVTGVIALITLVNIVKYI